jgi:hypothetical protein
MTKMFWIGLAILLISVVPLLAVLIFSHDPHPNPVGPGLLAGILFWPGIILTIIGYLRS